ncbi:MAG: MFS transporter [Alphaproteobacteria bacterium]|nr:MFS transporter [Alphaproteobacteria bacterium]
MTDENAEPVTEPASSFDHRKARQTVLVLAFAQALSMTGASIVMLVTALAGAYLAPDPRLATLPLAVQFVATMLTTFPAALWMKRAGRRLGFTFGQFVGIGGGSIGCYALLQGSFALLIVSAILLGAHNAFWGYYRFAAAEAAPPDKRAKAISLVMAGGIFSAVFGPELAKATRDLFSPVVFAGCYAAIAALSAFTVCLIQTAALTKPIQVPVSDETVERPLSEVMRQPKFIVAAISAMVGYGVMILVMSATPLSMVDCGFAFEDAAFVIQWHALAMFGPSFFTGSLIKKFGAVRIVLVGVVLNVGSMASNLAGIELINFWLGLVALGLGWNFMFIGGTALLTETYRQSEQEKTQAANDFLVFATISVATFSSGALQNGFGWVAVNGAMVLPLTVALCAVLWLTVQQRQAAS